MQHNKFERNDQRPANQLRPIDFQRHFTKYAEENNF